MAQLTIVHWRDIPAQVIVRRGRDSAKVQLGQRFQEAIDRAAMRANLRDSDAYLGEWRNSAPVAVGDDLRAEADAAAAALDAAYADERLERLVSAGGVEPVAAPGTGDG